MNNRTYYKLGNIGFWLTYQRKIAGVKRTHVARAMGWPGGAIKAIEEGRRIPTALTVEKYLATLRYLTNPSMYAKIKR